MKLRDGSAALAVVVLDHAQTGELDAPGTLHHLIGPCIERGSIFLDEADYGDFIESPVCRDSCLPGADSILRDTR